MAYKLLMPLYGEIYSGVLEMPKIAVGAGWTLKCRSHCGGSVLRLLAMQAPTTVTLALRSGGYADRVSVGEKQFQGRGIKMTLFF